MTTQILSNIVNTHGLHIMWCFLSEILSNIYMWCFVFKGESFRIIPEFRILRLTFHTES